MALLSGIVVPVAARYVALDDFFAQVAARGVGHKRNPAGLLHRHHIAGFAPALGVGGHGLADGFGQPVEVVLGQFEDEIVRFFQYVVPKGERKGGQSGIHLAQAGFFIGRQVDAGAFEALVYFFRQAGFLSGQPQANRGGRTPV